MATSNEVNKEPSGLLAMMSLDDFLQEKIPSPSKDDSAVLFTPVSLQWDRGRWNSGNSSESRYRVRGGGGGGGGRGRGVGGRPTQSSSSSSSSSWHPRKGGVRAGVLLAHDPPLLQPLNPKSKSLVRPMESVLTVGGREAQLVKEIVSGGAEGDLEVDLEKVLTNALPEHEVTFVLGQTLNNVTSGQRCHFFPVQDLGQVKRNTVLKLLVGFLNGGERGVIYMGVNESGCVEGITAESQLIGQFVEGLMKTVQFYLMPRLHSPQYGVMYSNVVTTSGQLLNNVWVVELHAVPQMQHYYNPVMDLNYYVRDGKETKCLPFSDFCDALVAETSKTHEPEIQKLKEKISRLRGALEAKGIDTSSVGPHVCDECWLNDCPVQCFGKTLTLDCDGF